MQFETSARELSFFVKAMTAIANDSIKNDYGCVKLSADDDFGAVRISATDGDCYLEGSVGAKVEEAGEAYINAKALSEILAKQSRGAVIIKSDDKKLTIAAKGCKTSVPCAMVDSFPEMSAVEGASFLINKEEYTETVDKVIRFVSTDNTRAILTGVYIKVSGEEMHAVALDGFKLSECLGYCSSDDELEMMIPYRSASIVQNLCKSIYCDEIQIKTNGKQMYAEIGGLMFTSSLIPGSYVDYKRFFRDYSKTVCAVKMSDLKASIDRAAVLAKHSNGIVKMKFEQGKLTIIHSSAYGESTEELDADVNGNDVELAFNFKYLAEVLNFDAENVVIELNSPVDPAIIHDVEESVLRRLVLPVRMLA